MKIFKNKKVLVSSLVLAIILGIACASIAIYNQNFAVRLTTPNYYKFEATDFPNLQAEQHIFSSSQGHKLVGYTYTYPNPDKKAVIVMAHGFGRGGHNSYLNIANFFAYNGYYVFAYDITGNDASEGEVIGGLPQGLIDLNTALNYIKTEQKLQDLTLMLFGHSWGGYSVSTVLNLQKDIKAVVEVSGFNKPSDILKEQGLSMVGNFIYLAMPFVNLYESYKFGDYASYSALDGLKNTTAKVLLIHSADDTTVQIKNSFDIYYEKLKDKQGFTFLRFENKGHGDIFNSPESQAYIGKFNRQMQEYFKAKNIKLTNSARTEYMNEHYDKKQATILDTELMEIIINFYNSALE